MMTAREWVMISGIISAGFGMVFDDAKTEVWFMSLQDLEYQGVNVAVQKLIRTHKDMLRPAHIVSEYYAMANPQKTTADAVGLLSQAMQKFGRYRTVEAMDWLKEQDVTVYEIAKAVGFINICNGDINFIRPEFERLHKEARTEIQTDAMLSNTLKSDIAKLSGDLQSRFLLTQGEYRGN